MGQDHGGPASQDARGLSGLSPRHSIRSLRWTCTLEQESLESHVIRKTVMRGSEEGRWKSTRMGNSLAAYPTARPVRRRGCRNVPMTPGEHRTALGESAPSLDRQRAVPLSYDTRHPRADRHRILFPHLLRRPPGGGLSSSLVSTLTDPAWLVSSSLRGNVSLLRSGKSKEAAV
jgi:hypothetical protein